MKSLPATASAVLGALALALAGVAYAAVPQAAPGDPLSGASGVAGFDDIKTAHISFNYDTGNFTLPDHFTASSKNRTISANRANGNSKQKELHAYGNVIVHQAAEMAKDKTGKLEPQAPSTLTSDKLDVDGIAKIYTASGNMHFTQVGGRDATADTASLDDTNHHLHMQGNVHVHDKDRTINADTVDYDTLSGQAVADGNVAITAPPGSADPLASPDPAAPSGVAGFDHIETGHMDFNYTDGDFTLPGHFSAANADTTIVADRATGNSKQKLLHASGNVVVHQDAQTRPGPGGKPQVRPPSTLTTDKLDVDGVAKIYNATGNMHYAQEGGRSATSDAATLNDNTHVLHMEGSVHVLDKKRTFSAKTMNYDTLTQQIDADGNVTITAPSETPPPGSKRITPLKKKKII